MFQPGNKLGGKRSAKEFRDALRICLTEYDGGEQKLRKVANALVNEAMSGNVNAIREIADRLDGRSDQQINLGLNDDITRFLIDLGAITSGYLELEAESDSLRDAMPGGNA